MFYYYCVYLDINICVQQQLQLNNKTVNPWLNNTNLFSRD